VQRVVGDVRPNHARLDAGGLDDVTGLVALPIIVLSERCA